MFSGTRSTAVTESIAIVTRAVSEIAEKTFSY